MQTQDFIGCHCANIIFFFYFGLKLKMEIRGGTRINCSLVYIFIWGGLVEQWLTQGFSSCLDSDFSGRAGKIEKLRSLIVI